MLMTTHRTSLTFDCRELAVQYLEPFRQQYQKFVQDDSYVEDVLREGGKKARLAAQQLMDKVRSATGLTPK